MKNLKMRESKNLLSLSIRFAKEYLNHLRELQVDIQKVQQSKKLTALHRALWTSLIIEVARLFDTHNDVISLKKIPHLKEKVDRYHSEAVIGKIIVTRNTFTGHFAKTAKEVISAQEICDSNLDSILDDLNDLPITDNNSEEH